LWKTQAMSSINAIYRSINKKYWTVNDPWFKLCWEGEGQP
jgi:hypothetical protein